MSVTMSRSFSVATRAGILGTDHIRGASGVATLYRYAIYR